MKKKTICITVFLMICLGTPMIYAVVYVAVIVRGAVELGCDTVKRPFVEFVANIEADKNTDKFKKAIKNSDLNALRPYLECDYNKASCRKNIDKIITLAPSNVNLLIEKYKTIKITPISPIIDELSFNLGINNKQAETKYKNLIGALNKIIELNPKDYFAYYERAETLERNAANHQLIIDDYTKVLESCPNCVDIYERRREEYKKGCWEYGYKHESELYENDRLTIIKLLESNQADVYMIPKYSPAERKYIRTYGREIDKQRKESELYYFKNTYTE